MRRTSTIRPVPSKALQRWRASRATELDRMEKAHVSVGGTAAGRRHTTEQINQAYAMLVSSHFQGFCRDLHSEAVAFLVAKVEPASMRNITQVLLTRDRKLSKGNPNPSNIGSDFERLGMEFWRRVNRLSTRNPGRQQKVENLNAWRNAIAHQDFVPLGGPRVLRLGWVRSWRGACDGLAGHFDAAVRAHIIGLVGTPPW